MDAGMPFETLLLYGTSGNDTLTDDSTWLAGLLLSQLAERDGNNFNL